MPTNTAPGVFIPSAALPTLAAGPTDESRLIRFELEEALSGGIRVVVDVYIFGRKRAYRIESSMPVARMPKTNLRLTQHNRRKRVIRILRASLTSSTLADSTSFAWVQSSEPGVALSGVAL
jgi:hypothetical protein